MIKQLKLTGGAGVATIWNDLLRYLTEHQDADASTVRRLVVGGSAAPESMMRRYQDELGIEIIHAWGMTETSPMGSVAIPPPRLQEGTDEYWSYRSSQGRLLAAVEGRIVGPGGTVQPNDGESVGELEIRGPWVAGSYLTNDGDAPADIEDRASRFTEDGWFRTGDVGALTPDRFLRLTDRSKDVIKSGGEWISSVELENHIMSHPEVVEASVVNIPDEKWGERPLATVVIKDGSAITTGDLRNYLSDKVAQWQLPERWAVIDEVPKTSVGKFDKKRLRERYAAGELQVEQPAD
jgi:fatty-acyl-CoA synthase